MIMNKIGIVYSSNEAYAWQTCVSMTSVLYNNNHAQEDRRVECEIYIFAENYSEESIQNIRQLAKEYDSKVHFLDSTDLCKRFENIDPEPWVGGTYSADAKILAGDVIDVDYNLVCLDSDVIMVRGTDLYELSVFSFPNNKKYCCASVVDPQSARIVMDATGLETGVYAYNTNGIFLINPVLFKVYNAGRIFEERAKKVAKAFKIYKDVTRNAYAFKDFICPLPIKYQIYPAQKLFTVDQFYRVFDITEGLDYYTKEEVKKGIEQAVFVHFINEIVTKPWIKNKLPFPYVEEWDFFQGHTPYRGLEKQGYDKSAFYAIKSFLFLHFRGLYVELCRLFYFREVRVRNKIVRREIQKEGIVL